MVIGLIKRADVVKHIAQEWVCQSLRYFEIIYRYIFSSKWSHHIFKILIYTFKLYFKKSSINHVIIFYHAKYLQLIDANRIITSRNVSKSGMSSPSLKSLWPVKSRTSITLPWQSLALGSTSFPRILVSWMMLLLNRSKCLESLLLVQCPG